MIHPSTVQRAADVGPMGKLLRRRFGVAAPAPRPETFAEREARCPCGWAKCGDDGFGRLPCAPCTPLAGAGTLAGPVDDLATQVADAAYDELKSRFYQDKDQLVEDLVQTATPKVQEAMAQLLNDTQTQAALGKKEKEIEDRIRWGVLGVAAASTVVTLTGVYVILKLTKKA